jgi:hypothetical protein
VFQWTIGPISLKCRYPRKANKINGFREVIPCTLPSCAPRAKRSFVPPPRLSFRYLQFTLRHKEELHSGLPIEAAEEGGGVLLANS